MISAKYHTVRVLSRRQSHHLNALQSDFQPHRQCDREGRVDVSIVSVGPYNSWILYETTLWPWVMKSRESLDYAVHLRHKGESCYLCLELQRFLSPLAMGSTTAQGIDCAILSSLQTLSPNPS